MGKVLSLKDLKQAVFDGKKELIISSGTILTPSAKDYILTGALKLVNQTKCSTESQHTNSVSIEQIKKIINSVSIEKNMILSDEKLQMVINEVYQYVNK
jgi:ethanolamine utilization cobalamin adenosyltransferase